MARGRTWRAILALREVIKNDVTVDVNTPVVVRLEKSGRAGKTVTVIENLPLHPEGKDELRRAFQKLCGAGGTLKMGVIEIQGDHRPRIKSALEAKGYTVRG